MRKRNITVLVIAILLGTITMFSAINYIFKDKTSPIVFSAERWSEEPYERYRMWESLCEQYHNFSGMTKSEIQNLLQVGDETLKNGKIELILQHGYYSDNLSVVYFSFTNDVFSGYNIVDMRI